MKPVILAVAPVPKRGKAVPFDYTPAHVAREVIACAEAGACLAHLHVLNGQGEETTDRALFDQTLQLIRRGNGIILQGSTGGSTDTPIAERSVSIENPLVQGASLNMGSVNFGDGVYCNPLPEVRGFAARIRERGIQAEMEIFDLSMLYVAMDFVRKGLAPPLFQLCFGFENAMPARPSVLRFLLEELRECPQAVVSVLHTGAKNTHFLRLALESGVDVVRVGWEDSTMDGETNVQLVKSLRQQAEAAGRTVAGLAEAKRRLGVQL